MTPEEPTTYTGGCFCERVRFEVQGRLSPATRCHCSLCRKRFGGTGSVMSALGDSRLSWARGQEHLIRYGEGFGLGFCGTCGSTLVAFMGEDVFGVAIGSLDGDPDVEIGSHVFVGSRARWDVIGDTAPQFHEWPTDPTS